MKKAIIIFQKNAQLGKVKTRLAKDVGDEKALEIYQFLTDYTHNYLKEIPVDKFLYYADFVEDQTVFPPNYYKCVQRGADLGERMFHAFHEVFKKGFRFVVIIGTDCYEINKSHIEQAFKALEKVDFVIGPADDGGYYLLGSSFLERAVFKDINWSTEEVFTKTIRNFDELEISYFVLTQLSDIDTVDDLKELKKKFNL